MATYRASQLRQVWPTTLPVPESPESIKIKLVSDCGETKWLNIGTAEFTQIKNILVHGV